MLNRTNPVATIVLGSLAVVGVMAAVMFWKTEPPKSEPLVVWCAAALSEPMKEIVPIYEQQTGQKIELRFGKSEEVLAGIKTTGQGDVFLPADESYVSKGVTDGAVEDPLPVGRMHAVLVQNRKNATQTTWDKVLEERDAKIAIAGEGAAIRDLVKRGLPKGQWDLLEKQSVSLGSVTDVANAVKLGEHVNFGIIWDQMLAGPNYKDDLVAVSAKVLEPITASVKVAVVARSQQPKEARAFAHFVSASCGDIFKKHGFTVGDQPKPAPAKEVSKAKPEITLFAGAMLRPAVEQTIKEFAEREGVKINTTYNGCGILVSQMKAMKEGDNFPDVYIACDPSFMDMVSDKFEGRRVLSKNQLVIAVPKGNPRGIKNLKDLGKQELKVGVGHEQQCALGAITQGVLIRTGTLKTLQDNIVVRAPAGDLLINQLRAGSLDAAVTYISNVKPYDDVEAIPIEEVNCAPQQPIGVSKTTAHPDVVKRLLKAIESAESKQRFENLGFGWEAKP